MTADTAATHRLLAAGEPDPVEVRNLGAGSRFLLACDHAGRRIPRALGDLGLPESELARHIAWDIGAAGVARGLADRLAAPLVAQVYSRLVIDCNRHPRVPGSMPEVSELTEIPGNRAIHPEQRRARHDEIFRPYHDTLVAELDRRAQAGAATLLVAVHSFTPVFKGVARPWHVGVLYNRNRRLAEIMMALFEAEGDLVVGDNEPYAVGDETDYTIPVHGEQRGIDHVELEIRQDLVADEAGQQAWAERLTRLLSEAAARLG
ncbi:Predicted N-formylglutamate amidohydrolase [Tistlia consotensis]|uniref:Predicted N-formylglutamate amidohydrolase n=1 Tax=Tistlia consotensis USBA 355 TaxID=560819 RepID=A0A1Y6CAL5_9PROT|nr:N-formylglutamate amidohydrolase [Tistlia consotensis]SMF45612.1 Predicted N-formylglutamate amidohydrolase [Tistlia consotensis USBA 355]SNR79606.1 Predicted N-formylglutamate amidohydrolase [Tistlia consotensis]